MSAATMNLNSDSLSSKNSIDEDTEHSQSRPAYLSGALYPGGSSRNVKVNSQNDSSYSSLTQQCMKSPVKQATTAIMDLKISTLDDQQKASWENHDSIHSKASTVASSMPHSGDDQTTGGVVFNDSACGFNESCASFASFGSVGDEDEDSFAATQEVSSLSFSNSPDILGLDSSHNGSGLLDIGGINNASGATLNKRSLLDSSAKDERREAL